MMTAMMPTRMAATVATVVGYDDDVGDDNGDGARGGI